MTRKTASILATVTVVVAVASAACLISGCASSSSLRVDRRWSIPDKTAGFAAEELWVIALPTTPAQTTKTGGPFRSPALFMGATESEQPLPLKQMAVNATVNDCLATVEVAQTFQNPARVRFDGDYVFQLPGDAAISEFVMTIGPRRIRGIIRECAEAERIYRDATASGYLATLLHEEHPAIFRLKVGNIEPVREIGVKFKYFQTLPYLDGWQQFTFPLPAIDGPASPPPPSLSLHVDVNGAANVDDIACDTHTIIKQSAGPGHVFISLAPDSPIARRNFVLRYRAAGKEPAAHLLVHRDGPEGHFALIAYPPKELGENQRPPLEACFVVDCSRGMAGQPLAQAKDAIRAVLAKLRPEDSFSILTLAGQQPKFESHLVAVSAANIQRGLDYVSTLQAMDANDRVDGFKAALSFPNEGKRRRLVCCLTSGRFGSDAVALKTLHENFGDARVYWVGLGDNPDRPLLNTLARLGNGAATYAGLQNDSRAMMESFWERVSCPALSNIHIEWGGLRLSENFPQAVPDLIVGRPILLTGRFKGAMPPTIRLAGKVGPNEVETFVPVNITEMHGPGDTLAGLWATAKIRSLLDRSIYEPGGDWARAIRQVALDFGLASPFTGYVAVDATRKTTDDIKSPIFGEQTKPGEK
jgi:Ca-activated chloride channel family protein